MKYLKKFESQGNSYERISSWHDSKQDRLHPIDSDERDKVINILPLLRKPIKKVESDERVSRTKLIFSGGVNRIDIDILSDDDEWYYVRILGNNIRVSYFKCDQFDGLIKCLQDEVIEDTILNESTKSDELYSTITFSEYSSEEMLYLPFTQEETEKISNLIGVTNGIKGPKLYNPKFEWRGPNNKYFIEITFNHHMVVLRKAPDEWYYVRIFANNVTYKCDQWEGFIQCIKDKILDTKLYKG